MQLRDKNKTTSLRTAAVAALMLAVAAFANLAGCGSTSPRTTVPPTVTTLLVSDSDNNRVLIYNSPFSTDESANVVLGQAHLPRRGEA